EGELMAVTLAAPIRPVTLEYEADLAELEELSIARVSIELKYNQFGKTITDSKNASLSPSAGEAMGNKVIYQDATSDKLSYRLIYHHKKLGKLTQEEWQPVEGNYIYCAPTEVIADKIKSALDL
ncbi:MAG: hypothetical protein JXL81_13890, partial [Deltaproteobacteria bacterium]|nr:hypothetical protein [Deltaproteobacteria bacterium]